MADQPYTGPEIDAAVRILREDAQLAHNAALMKRLDAIEDRMGRMPVKELSAEEKAAEYDRLIAAQGAGGRPPAGAPAPSGSGGSGDPAGKPAEGDGKPPAPPAKAPTPPAPTTTRRSWWDGYQSQGG